MQPGRHLFVNIYGAVCHSAQARVRSVAAGCAAYPVTRDEASGLHPLQLSALPRNCYWCGRYMQWDALMTGWGALMMGWAVLVLCNWPKPD